MQGLGARLGIDIGGTKIEGVVLDREGRERARKRVASPREDYAATIAAVRDLIFWLDSESGTCAPVGIGLPGSVSRRTGLIQNANSTWINGKPFGADIVAAIGRPSRLTNDANCFALSEATDGAGKDAAIVLGVIVGTGCGSGVIIGGQILDGQLGIVGEIGHTPLPDPRDDERPGNTCWCGRQNCLETWVSGPALATDHAHITGERMTVEEIAAAAAKGHEGAAASLERHASRLARGLAMAVNLLDPDVIVLGGGLSKLTHLYATLPRLILPRIFADEPRVVIKPPVWGDASGVRGAAFLAAP